VGSVTGANFLIEVANKKILVDCGLTQGMKMADYVNWDPFPYDPKEIDILFVTHAHIDHLGRIPKLVNDGFRGKIYSTMPTKELAGPMLDDTAGILSKSRDYDLADIYTEENVRMTLSLWEGFSYHEKIKLAGFFDFWKNSSRNYKSLVIGLLSFSLINSSDVFLLLKAKEFGVNDSYVIGLFMFYNLIYAFFSFPLGILADKIGLKIIFLFGLFIFAFTYFGMAFFTGNKLLIFLFFVYGLYAAATEGIGKAWISNLTDRSQMATALGTFTSLQSIATLISSSAAGLIWYSFGADALFIYTGIGTCLVIGYFAWWVPAAKA
jgi:hypothetical protein